MVRPECVDGDEQERYGLEGRGLCASREPQDKGGGPRPPPLGARPRHAPQPSPDPRSAHLRNVRESRAERNLQRFLGHKNAQSTRRYVRLADNVLVEILRAPPQPWRQAVDRDFENETEQDQRVTGGPMRPNGSVQTKLTREWPYLQQRRRATSWPSSLELRGPAISAPVSLALGEILESFV